MAYAARHQAQTSLASGLDVVAGIWLLISPFVLGFASTTGAMVNNVVLGIVIGILALIRASHPAGTAGISWVNVILGIWVLISPWVVGFAKNSTPTGNNVVMGIIVIILALWSALATTSSESAAAPPREL